MHQPNCPSTLRENATPEMHGKYLAKHIISRVTETILYEERWSERNEKVTLALEATNDIL